MSCFYNGELSKDTIIHDKYKVIAIRKTVNELKKCIMNKKLEDESYSQRVLAKLDGIKLLLSNVNTREDLRIKGVVNYNKVLAMVTQTIDKSLDGLNLDKYDTRMMEEIQKELFSYSDCVRAISYKVIMYFILGPADYAWYIMNVAYDIKDSIMVDFPNIKEKKDCRKYVEMIYSDDTYSINSEFNKRVTIPLIKDLDKILDTEYKLTTDKLEIANMYTARSLMIEFSNRENKRQTIKEFLRGKELSYETFKKCREKMKDYPEYSSVLSQFSEAMQEVSSISFSMILGTMQSLSKDIQQGLEYEQYCIKYRKYIKDMDELFKSVKSSLDIQDVRAIAKWIGANKSKDRGYTRQEILGTVNKDMSGNILYTNDMKIEVLNFINENKLPKTIGMYNVLIRKYKNTGILGL